MAAPNHVAYLHESQEPRCFGAVIARARGWIEDLQLGASQHTLTLPIAKVLANAVRLSAPLAFIAPQVVGGGAGAAITLPWSNGPTERSDRETQIGQTRDVWSGPRSICFKIG
jgi:hypothetical protein